MFFFRATKKGRVLKPTWSVTSWPFAKLWTPDSVWWWSWQNIRPFQVPLTLHIGCKTVPCADGKVLKAPSTSKYGLHYSPSWLQPQCAYQKSLRTPCFAFTLHSGVGVCSQCTFPFRIQAFKKNFGFVFGSRFGSQLTLTRTGITIIVLLFYTFQT